MAGRRKAKTASYLVPEMSVSGDVTTSEHRQCISKADVDDDVSVVTTDTVTSRDQAATVLESPVTGTIASAAGGVEDSVPAADVEEVSSGVHQRAMYARFRSVASGFHRHR